MKNRFDGKFTAHNHSFELKENSLFERSVTTTDIGGRLVTVRREVTAYRFGAYVHGVVTTGIFDSTGVFAGVFKSVEPPRFLAQHIHLAELLGQALIGYAVSYGSRTMIHHRVEVIDELHCSAGAGVHAVQASALLSAIDYLEVSTNDTRKHIFAAPSFGVQVPGNITIPG